MHNQRANDGVHMSLTGGNRLGIVIYQKLASLLDLSAAPFSPDPSMAPPPSRSLSRPRRLRSWRAAHSGDTASERQPTWTLGCKTITGDTETRRGYEEKKIIRPLSSFSVSPCLLLSFLPRDGSADARGEVGGEPAVGAVNVKIGQAC